MAAMFTEHNSGWKPQPDTAGGYDIVEGHGWTLATVNYDYRFTCNATNLSRANMIAAAPEMLAALQQVEREMQAGLGSSYGETREQIRRSLSKALGTNS